MSSQQPPHQVVYQSPPQQVVYQQVVKGPGNGLAVASLVLGIVAATVGVWSPIPFVGVAFTATAFVPAVLAVVFGHTGLAASRRSGSGRGLAITGIVLGYLTLGISLIVTVIWISMLSTSSYFGLLSSWL